MPNIFWYVLISAIGLGVSVFTICAKRKAYKVTTFITLYLFAAGLSWVGEFSVLGLFNSYAYVTGVFSDPWAQNLLGHLLLNSTLYPAAAIVMVGYSFGYGWILFISALFTSFEFFFVRMGLYEQHWWKYYFTIITSIIYLLFIRWWFTKINRKQSVPIRVFTFFFVALVVVHFPAPILMLLGMQHYESSFIRIYFNNFYLSSIMFNFSYHMVECFLIVIFTCILKKWFWKAAPFVISIVAQSLFAEMHILVLENGWKLIYSIFVYAVFIALFELLERFSLRPDPNRMKPNRLYM